MEHDPHPTELLAGYALGILEMAETVEVQTHVESCPQCQAEVAALREVSNLLALAVPLLEPPARLRHRVLEHAGQKAGPVVNAGKKNEGQQSNGSPKRRFSLPFRRPVAVGFILLLLIGNIYFLFRLQTIGSQSPLEQQTINLGATENAPGADGILLVRQGEATGTLIVNGLPNLDPEQQYQLWLVKDEVRISGAVFSVSEDGFTSIAVSAPEPLPSYTRFGITIEPTGGSPGPTGNGVLRSTVGN